MASLFGRIIASLTSGEPTSDDGEQASPIDEGGEHGGIVSHEDDALASTDATDCAYLPDEGAVTFEGAEEAPAEESSTSGKDIAPPCDSPLSSELYTLNGVHVDDMTCKVLRAHLAAFHKKARSSLKRDLQDRLKQTLREEWSGEPREQKALVQQDSTQHTAVSSGPMRTRSRARQGGIETSGEAVAYRTRAGGSSRRKGSRSGPRRETRYVIWGTVEGNFPFFQNLSSSRAE